jgi:alkylated DNA repair dioxygenase AlkB
MNAPITYIKDCFKSPMFDDTFEALMRLDWIQHENVPRKEYYVNKYNTPYTYGRGAGVRTYYPQKWTVTLIAIQAFVESHTNTEYDVCFLNRYDDGSDQLGWHSDDSPEMDDTKPIAIVTFGAEREIWFRETPKPFLKEIQEGIPKGEMIVLASGGVEKLRLGNGSICIMAPGMQDTHQHRIPKSDRPCGPRISLTFRGYVKGE